VIGILSPWPPSVATGSGTTVSQNRLVEALGLAGAPAEMVYSSRFATTPREIAERKGANDRLGSELERFEAIIGIDGEGWLWAAKPREQPYVAFCEAVLANVVPFEPRASATVLEAQARWEAESARAADAVVARSEYAAERVTSAYAIPRERITVLPVPFDLDAWRGALPLLPREPIVLAVGHAYPRKNYRGLLAAWPAVKARHQEAVLAIAGAGPEAEQLRAEANGVAGARVLGHLAYHDLLALYARATVFCHPSLQENFGLAPLEGLASGASLVVHEQPALMENLAGVPGVWALDARDPEALAQALIMALDARVPWPATRLNALRSKLDPLTVGQRLRTLLTSLALRPG
jgi:glycosyltransferase involved in cell wall biosynthesis